jgi:hypothetical protein
MVSAKHKIAKLVAESFRANATPALVSFMVSVIFITIYYTGGDDVKNAFEAVGELKTATSYLGSFILTGTSAGLLPMILLQLLIRCRKNSGAKSPGSGKTQFYYAALFFVYWGVCGMLVQFLYETIMINLFGTKTNVSTVAYKVLFDQFVFNAFFMCHMSTFCLRYLEVLKQGGGFSLGKTARSLCYTDEGEEDPAGSVEPVLLQGEEKRAQIKECEEAEQGAPVDVVEVNVTAVSTPALHLYTDHTGNTTSVDTASFCCEKYFILAVANLVSTWCTFVPSCCIIYSMPSDLQLVLFNTIIFFFSMVLITLQNKSA